MTEREKWNLKLAAVAEFRKLSVIGSKGSAYRKVVMEFLRRGLSISEGTLWRWVKAYERAGKWALLPKRRSKKRA